MANVFGTSYPVAISDEGGGSEVEVDFTYGIITRSEPTTEYVEHRSQLDGQKALINRGCHWVVEIRYHLYKEGNPTTWYNTLIGLKGKNDFTLLLHANGPPFYHDAGTTRAMFCLKEIVPFYLTTTDYKDGLMITFESVDTVSMDITIPVP